MFTFTSQKVPARGITTLVFSTDAVAPSLTKENGHKVLTLPAPKRKEKTLVPQEQYLRRRFVTTIRKGVRLLKTYKETSVFIDADSLYKTFLLKDAQVTYEDFFASLATEISIANYDFDAYKSKKEITYIKSVFVYTADRSKEFKDALIVGGRVGEYVNRARDLANTPGQDMTPEILANDTKKLMKGLPVSVTVFDEKKMKALQMNAILAVGRGSKQSPRFIIAEYWGAKDKKNPIVLVGKGVTFDTGGVNVKPGDNMLEMHMDMSGGAAVLATLALVAKEKLKINVVALVPAVENMPSGSSYVPGDVIHSMSGTTIEVLNTDAEGRVILSDALTYAEKYKPKAVIDVATLTGAIMVALGERMNGLFSNDHTLAQSLVNAGDATHDFMWHMPLTDEFEKDIEGQVGDVTNTHNKSSRYGGAISGAIFLYQFAKKYPWAHIDMAPLMTSIAEDNLAPGAKGSPVRALFAYIANETKRK